MEIQDIQRVAIFSPQMVRLKIDKYRLANEDEQAMFKNALGPSVYLLTHIPHDSELDGLVDEGCIVINEYDFEAGGLCVLLFSNREAAEQQAKIYNESDIGKTDKAVVVEIPLRGICTIDDFCTEEQAAAGK